MGTSLASLVIRPYDWTLCNQVFTWGVSHGVRRGRVGDGRGRRVPARGVGARDGLGADGVVVVVHHHVRRRRTHALQVRG